jgi:hypothetical protein
VFSAGRHGAAAPVKLPAQDTADIAVECDFWMDIHMLPEPLVPRA